MKRAMTLAPRVTLTIAGESNGSPRPAEKPVAIRRRLAAPAQSDEGRSTSVVSDGNAGSERLFVDAVNASVHALVTLDLAGTVTAWNAGAVRLFGYSAAEMIGSSIARIVPADDREQVDAVLERIRRDQPVEPYEAMRVAKNGQPVDILVTVTPVRVASGELVGSFAIATDVTKRKHAERMFGLAFEACPSGMLMMDGEGIISLANGEIERLFGYGRDELLGKPVAMIVPGIHRLPVPVPTTREGLGAVLSTPRQSHEALGRRRDGSDVPIELTLNSIQTVDGFFVLVVILDLTERKKAEATLREYAARQQMLIAAVDSSNDAIVTETLGGLITNWNRGAEEMFGYAAAEAVGSHIEIFVPEDQRAEVRDTLRRIGGGERVAHHETVRRTKDGRRIDVSVAMSPLAGADGSIIGAAAVARDISDRKRLKDEFVSTVNHELRTPLTSISGSLALLTSGAAGQLPDRASRLLVIAHRNSQRLVRLINDILDIEKMESGQMVFHLTRVEVRSLVEQAIEVNRSFAESMGVGVRLAEASQAADVCADPDRLFQVVTNLLSNAVKFSAREGEVVVAVEAQEDRVRLSVRDHGPGISLEFRSRIFQRFAQAETVDLRHRGGSGLGLNIVRQIVTRLGGEVGFDDAPGGGTNFHVTLPLLAPMYGAEGDESTDDARSLADEDDRDTMAALGNRLQLAGLLDGPASGADEAASANRESGSHAAEEYPQQTIASTTERGLP
jgi:PAS domain S-box-containing protein